ncbi:putative ribonuclease H-like domain-containing protein [Tanacetum coccineum]|uniref:Ribonuclease H-like domain-containing protein n=1 Tax=Tanacetum coccineum TaxID=301880 RepID=A0ABQ5A6A9_9ASTR
MLPDQCHILSKTAHLTVKWPIHKNKTFKNSNFNKRVNIVKDKNVNTAMPKAVVNTAKPKAVGNPQQDLEEKGVIDSGCSRHMTGNMSYLTDFEEIDGGYVAFGGNPKGGKITGRAERKNRTLIEAAKTMLADSKLPTTFWAEAVNTACYVQNRVLVTKPHNKTPYELFLERKPALGFMRPFGCPVTILNTIDHLGKFDGKADEGFFVGYSINSKAFKVFNSRTRIVEENLHVQFSENTSNIVGSGPNWLFDIDALTKSMNYKPVVAGNQSNGNAGTKTCDDAGKARIKTVPGKDYILLPLWHADLPFSQNSKSSPDAGFKPLGDNKKKVTKEPGKEGGDPSNKNDSVSSTNNINTASDGNSTNNVNIVSSTVNTVVIEVNAASNDYEDVGAEDDMSNLNTFMLVSPIPTIRIHKYHPVEQIIRDLNSSPQTRRMTKNLEEHEEPKKVIHALKDPSWIEAMQEELLQFKLQEVWTLVDLPNGKRAIGTKCIFRNKKDERGIVIKNKARLVAQGYTQEEGIDYNEVFGHVAKIEAIRLFLAYASFKDFVVYQMDVKSAFLYGKIEEEVYVCQPPRFEDPDFPNRVYKVEKALYGLHQAPKAWYETLSTYLLDNGFQKGKIDKTLFIRRDKRLQVKQKEDGIFISQDKYVTEILKKFGFSDVKTTSIHMETQKPLLKDEDGEEVDVHLYRYCFKLLWPSALDQIQLLDYELQALVDGKKIIITEATARRDLQLEDANGIDCLPNATIFKQLTLIGMVKNLDSAGKFLMYPRFVQVFLDNQLEGMINHNIIYIAPSHTKQVFANMKRQGKDFSSRVTPLFSTMMVQAQHEQGEGLDMPTDPHHTPTIIPPSTSQPQRKQRPRKPKRKDTKIP